LLIAAATMTAQAAGPDVIVGELPDVSNFTSSGAIGGKRSYSVGTTSCNVGDVPLLWISSTNQHPVISGNIYRILDGKFEQLGQSWLKHGFTALQGSVCGPCTANPNGTRLGVGCSDPYSSGLNGSQGGLGPKSEVNASTGAFPYPWVNRGTSATALDKRIIVNDADMGVSGAQYFVASMYVAPDDALAGNALNNQSYRGINVNATNKDISLTGTTRRQSPAIFAWRDTDPSVVLNSVDVAGDGRFWVGVKVAPNGTGGYRYFYAVQNLNSHQGGQSFTVPIPAAAVISNVTFRDVDYHSGEPFALTDWTPTVTSSSVSWSTQTFAQNQNANALRFDTVYNFSFDCNLPPAAGNAALGLFRSGGSVAASTLIPSPDGQYHPVNDTCASAVPVVAGVTSFDTTGAATDGFEEPGACAISGYTQIGSDIWYRFTNGNCSGPITMSTCGSAFDTKLAIYAACPTGPGQAIACNDDLAGCANRGSQVTFTGTAGATYLVRVGGFNAATGAGSLSISVPNCGPTNETCAGSIWLADGVNVAGNTTNATDDGDASCGAAGNSPDLWYRYRPTTTGNVVFTTCDSVGSYDTVLSIFTGTCGALAEVGCNDDTNGACGLRSTVTVAATAGTTYYVRVGGYNGASGAFRLKASGGAGISPPANDDCANRSGIPLGDTPFTTVGASTDGPAHASCNFFGNNQVTNDVWFNYPSGCDGRLQISTCAGTPFDSKIAVYDGYGCLNYETRLLACSDDDCGPNQSTVTINAVSGAFYTIRVGGFNGATGAGVLRLECLPNCLADFDQNGGVDGGDIDAFFTAWENGDSAADMNLDGGVDGEDVSVFFGHWEAGC